jgi:hypothetical protein
VTAATAAITSDPSFTAALAAAITSIISQNNQSIAQSTVGQSALGQVGVNARSAFTSVSPSAAKLGTVSTPRAAVPGDAAALSSILSSAFMTMSKDQPASGVIKCVKPSATHGALKEVHN